MQKGGVILLLAWAVTMWAGECRWRVQDINVTWEAYKTPLKIGVKGRFDAIKLTAKPASKIDDLLNGARVVIDTSGIDSGNSARDTNLIKHFFQVQHISHIEAQIVRVEGERLDIDMTINGKQRRVPMRLVRNGEALTARGVIDLADFDMLPALESLTRACAQPHEEKTWQDVDIALGLRIHRKCP